MLNDLLSPGSSNLAVREVGGGKGQVVVDGLMEEVGAAVAATVQLALVHGASLPLMQGLDLACLLALALVWSMHGMRHTKPQPPQHYGTLTSSIQRQIHHVQACTMQEAGPQSPPISPHLLPDPAAAAPAQQQHRDAGPDAATPQLHLEPCPLALWVQVVSSAEQALALIERGDASRKVGSTAYNDDSSRSHTITRLCIESQQVCVDRSAGCRHCRSRMPRSLPGCCPALTT